MEGTKMADEVKVEAAVAAEAPAAAENSHGVDLVSVMRMMMADPQLSSMIEAMVDHVLCAPRKNNPLGKALDDAVGIVETHPEEVPAAAAAVSEEPEPHHTSQKSLSELADEIAQFELSTSALTGKHSDGTPVDAPHEGDDDEDKDLTDSLTDSFAEIKIPTGSSHDGADVEQPAVPASSAAAAAVPDVEQHDEIPPYPDDTNDDSDDEFTLVSNKDSNTPEQPEMFQQAPPSRGVFSGIVGLFGRPQNPPTTTIRVDKNAIELQKELREMGFRVSTPRVAQLLAQYKTREAVVNHLLTSGQRR